MITIMNFAHFAGFQELEYVDQTVPKALDIFKSINSGLLPQYQIVLYE